MRICVQLIFPHEYQSMNKNKAIFCLFASSFFSAVNAVNLEDFRSALSADTIYKQIMTESPGGMTKMQVLTGSFLSNFTDREVLEAITFEQLPKLINFISILLKELDTLVNQRESSSRKLSPLLPMDGLMFPINLPQLMLLIKEVILLENSQVQLAASNFANKIDSILTLICLFHEGTSMSFEEFIFMAVRATFTPIETTIDTFSELKDLNIESKVKRIQQMMHDAVSAVSVTG